MKHTHNLLPGPARAVRELLLSGEFEQCTGHYAIQRGNRQCRCIFGIVREACRRETGSPGAGITAAAAWATGTMEWDLADPSIDGHHIIHLNDVKRWTFADFAAALAEEGVGES